MTLLRTIYIALFLTASVALSACHVHGHLPPGQLKQVISPPPGHGGVPPGQAKKLPE
jgi:hypothetical protein